MATLKVYTYKDAGVLLGGDNPLSTRTIERMVQAGDLERTAELVRRVRWEQRHRRRSILVRWQRYKQGRASK